MSYWGDMESYARKNIDDIDDQEASMTISTNTRYEGEVEVSLTWMEERERMTDASITDELPTTRRVRVPIGTIRDETEDLFNQLENAIGTNASIESITVKQVDDEYPFEHGEYAVVFGLENTEETTSFGENLTDQISDLMSSPTSDDEETEVVEAEAVYNDFKTCSLANIRASLRTQKPYEYFSNVETMDDVLDKIDDPEEAKNASSYIVPFVVRSDEDLDEDIQDKFEDLMMQKADSMVELDADYDIEGESLFVKNSDSTDDEYLFTRLEEFKEVDVGEQSVYFWIHADPESLTQFDFDSN